jgi:excisionase family DNA binding protein
METVFKKTSKNDQVIVKKYRSQVSQALGAIIKRRGQELTFQLGGMKQPFKAPKSAVLIFFEILEKMAEGSTIAVLLSDDNSELSTQQAAEILGSSRPHIVSLLERGEIPFKKVGTHRRVRLKDVLAYQQKMKKVRAANLDALAREAQDLNMGY